jgi:hypothetical protein
VFLEAVKTLPASHLYPRKGIRCLAPPRRPQKPGDEEINDDIPF